MWANLPKDYAIFNRKAIEASQRGTFADIACGTLSFLPMCMPVYFLKIYTSAIFLLKCFELGKKE